MKKRVCLVDDHPLMREGLAGILTGMGMDVCGQSDTAAEAFETVPELRPDLVIMDLSLPDKSGLELMKDLLARMPGLPILIFSMHDEAFYAERVVRAGGKGYVMKGSGVETIKSAIRRVMEGELFLSSRISNQILTGLTRKTRSSGDGLGRLSDREFEVFGLIGQGMTNLGIAERLGISVRTVDAHRTNLKTKLNLPDGAALVRMAILWADKGTEALHGPLPGA